MKQVIVTGGREYDDWCMMDEVMQLIRPDMIIQGGAAGADRLARDWAHEYKGQCQCVTVEADWAKHGKAAGPMRNREMLEKYPQAYVIAFPGGKGTANCVKQAYELNRIILQVHK